MATSQRAAILTKLHKVLKKHYKPVSPPADRTLLEHLLYACCLENASYEKADEAFARLQQSFFDWNEVRVSTAAELSESLAELPDPMEQATHLKRLLQAVFESHYSFDLELLKKQNLGKSEKQLENYAGATRFVVSYGVQHGLEGHAIPIDRGALDIMEILEIITPQEAEKKSVPGLERAIPKNKGIEFGSMLHQFSADYVAAPTGSKIRAMLIEVDANSKGRVPTRLTKPEPSAPTVANRPMPAPAPAKPAGPAGKGAAGGKPSPEKGTEKGVKPGEKEKIAPGKSEGPKGAVPPKPEASKGASHAKPEASKGATPAKPEAAKGAPPSKAEPAPKAGAKEAEKGKAKEPAARVTPPRPAPGKPEAARSPHPGDKKGSEPRRKEGGEKAAESSTAQSPPKRLAKKKPR